MLWRSKRNPTLWVKRTSTDGTQSNPKSSQEVTLISVVSMKIKDKIADMYIDINTFQ